MSNFEDRVKSQAFSVQITDPAELEALWEKARRYGFFIDDKQPAANKSATKSGVPGPVEVQRALSRLEILPNPANPSLSEDERDKYVESPWATTDAVTVDPNVWDNAIQVVVRMDELTGTDPYLKRKRVRKGIEAMGQSNTAFRSLPLTVDIEGRIVIIDGHHRLMAQWLLGNDTAPVWKVTI